MGGAILVQISGALPDSGPFAPLSFPLMATGLLSLGSALVALATIPGSSQLAAPKPVAEQSNDAEATLVWRLLFLAFVVAAAVGLFEVGLVLRGQRELGLAPYQVATMFSECSLIMFVVQAIVFSPLVKPDSTRWLIVPALIVLAAGLFLLPRTSDYILMIGVVGAIASSAGVLSPIVTYWISTKAGAAQGTQLGRQTAAASLGGTFGSVAGGMLFDLPGGGDVSFLVAAAGVLIGFLAAVGLPGRLAPGGNLQAIGSNHEHSTSRRVRRPF
jgi:predicted MFS family arabinose efflux permease